MKPDTTQMQRGKWKEVELFVLHLGGKKCKVAMQFSLKTVCDGGLMTGLMWIQAVTLDPQSPAGVATQPE